MSLWIWVPFFFAGVFVLLLFLFRIHYRFDWKGGLDFSAELDYGFPGFKRVWKFSPTPDAEAQTTSATSSTSQIPASRSKSRFNRERGQRALFLFITDTAVLRALIRYGLGCLRHAFRLLHLELNFAVSRSDPAQLGRFAGYWYATRPFIPTQRIHCEFRFEDPKPSLQLRVRGGFSAAQALVCLCAIIGSFPWFLIMKKAWRSWRNPELSGWRARIFGWIRKAQRTNRNS